MHNIQTSGNNLMVMINDLLDLAKIESGRDGGPGRRMFAGRFDRATGDSLNPLAEKKNIDLSQDVDPELPMLIQDSEEIPANPEQPAFERHQVHPRGGRVASTARRLDETMFELVVEDTGIGIPLDEQATIFQKFRRTHRSRPVRRHDAASTTAPGSVSPSSRN